ncbi:hypothetical protein [Mycolicibacterium aromaticivorans]|uniref:hypothetical protein n=1 Tax=Mycolicibacterium aromaticivorans TaxID=318425 RepID=UPI0004BB7B76|nr:hypothetical protein [Mycolicibacterium aromaticivorans]
MAGEAKITPIASGNPAAADTPPIIVASSRVLFTENFLSSMVRDPVWPGRSSSMSHNETNRVARNPVACFEIPAS